MRREAEQKQRMEDIYTHFPFTGGEMLEAHRNRMHDSIREDFKNFLQSRSNLTPQISETTSLAGSLRLSKNAMTPGKLKPLFDSCYMPPNKNPCVIQDSDPVKSMTILDAYRRHQEKIE
jgi:hypothetical protein